MIDGGLSALIRANLKGWDLQRIESGLTGLGIPDLNYCHAGREGWVELKQTKGWVVGIRPDQVGWIERRVRHGGRVTVMVRQGGLGRDCLWVLAPSSIRLLRDRERLDRLPSSLVLARLDPPWDWEKVRQILLRSETAQKRP